MARPDSASPDPARPNASNGRKGVCPCQSASAAHSKAATADRFGAWWSKKMCGAEKHRSDTIKGLAGRSPPTQARASRAAGLWPLLTCQAHSRVSSGPRAPPCRRPGSPLGAAAQAGPGAWRMRVERPKKRGGRAGGARALCGNADVTGTFLQLRSIALHPRFPPPQLSDPTRVSHLVLVLAATSLLSPADRQRTPLPLRLPARCPRSRGALSRPPFARHTRLV